MKVAIDARSLKKNLTGVGQCTYHLVDQLLQKNVKCLLFVGKDKKTLRFKNTSNLETIKVPENCAISLERYKVENFLFKKILQKIKVDLYHAMDTMGVPNIDIPKVLTVHDLIPLKLGENLNFWTKILYRYSIRKSVTKADHIIVISNFTKEELHAYLKIPKEKITTIYNGYHIADYSKVTKKDLNFDLPEDYIIYVGGFGPRKNMPNMIRAYHKFIKKYPDGPSLFIIGKKKPDIKKGFTDYIQLIEKLGLKDKAFFTGYIDDRQLAFVRSGALFALYVSTYEGFGLPIIEAMAQGVPVITSNITAMPEIAGGATLLADPYNIDDIFVKIDKLYRDVKLRNSLIKKGKKRAKDFSWEKMAKKTLEVYKSLLNVK